VGKEETMGDLPEKASEAIGKTVLIIIVAAVVLVLIVVIAYYSIFSSGGTPAPAIVDATPTLTAP
jgi:flagellar basal body-associated protein FliL